MKKTLYGIIGLALSLMLSVIISVCLPVAGIAYATGTVVTGGTVTQQAATGGDTFVETTEYLDMKDVQTKVELYKPYQTPLLTLMADTGAGSTDSWETKYYAVDSRGLSTTCSSATAISNNITTLTVADNSIFTVNNTVFFTSITGATKRLSTTRSLVGLVTAIGTGTITVKLLNVSVATPDLTNADFAGVTLYRGGSAMNEKAASTTAWGILPDYDYNYVQYFMEQIEMTEYQEVMKKEANWNFADLKRMAIDDFKLQRERSFLNGVRAVTNITVSGSTQRIYTCGGFLQDTGIPVSSSIDLSALDGAKVNEITKDTFTGNNGSKKRFLLGGSDVVEALENVYVDNKWITAKETENVLGIDFVKIVSMFGTLDVAYYEQLDLLGKAKTAIIVDKANVSTADLTGHGFNVRKIDYKTSGISKVDAAAIEQYSTMLIKNKTTHRILEGV